MKPQARSFALEVAPASQSDRDTDEGAALWLASYGLSMLAHVVAVFVSVAGPVFFALVPIPLLAAMCVDVKPVVKPLVRVELALYQVSEPVPTPAAAAFLPCASEMTS